AAAACLGCAALAGAVAHAQGIQAGDAGRRAMDQDVPGLPPTPVSKDQYKLAQDRITDDFRAAQKTCEAMSGSNRAQCLAEAQAKEKISRSELEARYADTGEARLNARMNKAEADYAVAARKCEAFSSSARSECLEEARQSLGQARSEARAQFGKS
ncbi:MAG TPA: hypothetical protein VN667_01755, partial [Burkholderiales bacterium]|nr:hypothetical protein [Burkholderiales bacterium]